jgi:DNA-directed RNA polymerase subunit RPC12/RpoP
MALVPVRCPGCGASVELEEGQQLAKCGYCGETSLLAAPRPAPQPIPARPEATAPAEKSRGGRIVLAVVVLAVVGLFGALAYVSGVGLDYLAGGPSMRSFLVKRFGSDARFVSMHLQSGYLHVKMIGPDNTLIGQRFDGRSARNPEPDGKASPEEIAQAFTLDDVDFDVVEKVARHARKRQPDGELGYILLGRPTTTQADVLWAAHMKVAGEYKRWLYDLEGEPLVDDVRNYIAPKAEWFAGLEKRVGTNVVELTLQPNYATVRVLLPKSERDVDEYLFDADGALSTPRPASNSDDAATLKAKLFRLGDIDWKGVTAAIADAKTGGEEVSIVSIERDKGQLTITVHSRNKRGASRMVTYDPKGKRLSGP